MGRVAQIAVAVVAAALAGGATAIAILVAGAAFYWLYLFGDDPWPSSAQTALVAVAYIAGTVVFLGVLFALRAGAKGGTANRSP